MQVLGIWTSDWSKTSMMIRSSGEFVWNFRALISNDTCFEILVNFSINWIKSISFYHAVYIAERLILRNIWLNTLDFLIHSKRYTKIRGVMWFLFSFPLPFSATRANVSVTENNLVKWSARSIYPCLYKNSAIQIINSHNLNSKAFYINSMFHLTKCTELLRTYNTLSSISLTRSGCEG